MVLSYEVSTRTSSVCNKLLLEERKCTLDIKKSVSIYNQNYIDIHLKQSNIINFNALYL